MVPEDSSGMDIEMVAASLRADSSDLDTYANVLLNTLGGAFPDNMVSVDRDRSMGDRMAGRPGKVTSVRITFDDVSLQLQRGPGGRPQALAVTTVGGVTISRKELPLTEWSTRLADKLVAAAEQSRDAAASLNRLLDL